MTPDNPTRIILGTVVLLAGTLIHGAEDPKPAAPTDSTLYTDEEIHAKYREVTPKESDFKFSPEAGWSSNLALRATLTRVSPEEDEADKTVDGRPATTWTARGERATAELVLDLGKERRFDRLVVFNRQTDQKGTGGGNNAVRRIALSVADNESSEGFQTVGQYDLEGPFPVCFKRKAGGQMCAFIDRAEPNIVELPAVRTRYVKLEFQEAFWGADAEPSWKTSIAVSEILLFDSRNEK